MTLADPAHRISALYNLVNVPSAVWIDESGVVRRIDEGAYAAVHNMGDFEFGRTDYAPMVTDWVARGEDSTHVSQPMKFEPSSQTDAAARAKPAFRLGVHFKQLGDEARAATYWSMAQELNPDSWNYHRQDWSYTPEEAGANWVKKVESLGDKPYYRPVEGLDSQGD